MSNTFFLGGKKISRGGFAPPAPHLVTGLGTRSDKYTKKLESKNYAGTLPRKVFIAS